MTNQLPTPTNLPEEFQLVLRLEKIFMPYATNQRRAFYERDGRFAHYTSAEAALSIITSKRLWMRNTTCMSDYREVRHGFDMINGFFLDQAKKASFTEAVDQCFPGAADEAITLFNQWWADIQVNTYIASISEHDRQKEDSYGRLSMWRAFGAQSEPRVAIVFRIPCYSGAGQAMNLLFSPVAYLDEKEVHAQIFKVIDNLRANRDFLASIDRQRFGALLFFMLLCGVVCLKHPAFHEEREWRAIYSPKRASSPLVELETKVVGGVPQPIHKIPLDQNASPLVADLDFSRLFDRLIIGPSPYPWVLYEAFVSALISSGVHDAANRVLVSNIPIRS